MVAMFVGGFAGEIVKLGVVREVSSEKQVSREMCLIVVFVRMNAAHKQWGPF